MPRGHVTLEVTLARALARAPITPAERATLGAEIDGTNAVVLGRLVRLGLLSSTEREALAKFPADAPVVEGIANAELDRFARGTLALTELVIARDAAESVLVLLGFLGAEDAERRLFARAAKVDETMLLRRDEWSASAVTSSGWLERLAELDASTWWLDLVALGVVRARFGTNRFAQSFADVPRASAVSLHRSARPKQADLRLYAEVVGMEDDPARVAVERGDVIARLFDGEVEVFAVGLRADQEDLPAGLCVVRASSGSEGITGVEIRGVEIAQAGKSTSGWWIPLSADLAGARELVVRLAGGEEVLALDLSFAR